MTLNDLKSCFRYEKLRTGTDAEMSRRNHETIALQITA